MSVMWHDLSKNDSDTPAVDSPLNEKAGLVGRVGLMLLSAGAGAFRVRAAMNKISRALDITCNADIGIKSVEYTCISGSEMCTNALSNVSTGVNTEKLHYLEMFCDGFGERVRRYSVDDFHQMLDTIQKGCVRYRIWQQSLAAGIACASFAFLLGASLFDIILTFFASALGFTVRKLLLERHITLYANTSAGVFVSSLSFILISMVMMKLFGIGNDSCAGLFCSILFIIPGFPLITGGIDLAKLDLRSGIERTVYAFLVIFVGAVTCAFTMWAFKLSPVAFEAYDIEPGILYSLRIVASFLGVYGFSVIFNSPAKMAFIAGIIGSIANVTRLLLIDLDVNISLASFCGAFLAGLLASAIKRYIGFPRITITVPSIVIMVPGLFLYRGLFFMTITDFSTSLSWLCRAVLMIVALPLGLVFARILTDKNFRQSS